MERYHDPKLLPLLLRCQFPVLVWIHTSFKKKEKKKCMTRSLSPTHRVDGVDQFAGLAELHEALPQVV